MKRHDFSQIFHNFALMNGNRKKIIVRILTKSAKLRFVDIEINYLRGRSNKNAYADYLSHYDREIYYRGTELPIADKGCVIDIQEFTSESESFGRYIPISTISEHIGIGIIGKCCFKRHATGGTYKNCVDLIGNYFSPFNIREIEADDKQFVLTLNEKIPLYTNYNLYFNRIFIKKISHLSVSNLPLAIVYLDENEICRYEPYDFYTEYHAREVTFIGIIDSLIRNISEGCIDNFIATTDGGAYICDKCPIHVPVDELTCVEGLF